MRKIIMGCMLLAAGLAVNAETAQAAGYNSSMYATCVGGVGTECASIRFILNVQTVASINNVSISSTNTGLFAFSGVTGVWAGGVDALANASVASNNVTAQISDNLNLANGLPLPVVIETSMSTYGTQAQAIDGTSFTYVGDIHPQSQTSSFGGTVTPEPISVLLLGTGLAGVAAIRRRREGNVEEDEA